MLEKLKFFPSKNIKSTFYHAILILLLCLSSSISAKVICTGQVCEVIPQKYISQFDNIDAAFQSQYLQPVMQSMIEAAVISNNNAGMIGLGHVNRFQIGAGMAAGVVRKDEVTVAYGDMRIPKLPNAGISATPTVMAAFNLGWILGRGPSKKENEEKDDSEESDDDDDDDDDKSYLHRFNFYFHGMKTDFHTSDLKAAYGNKPELSGRAAVESFGAMVRYQLIEPRIQSFTLFGFSGVSLGLGYNMQNFILDFNHQPKANATINFGELQGSWAAKTQFEFASNVRSIPIEVRTGVKVLLFDVYCGVGLSKNFGTADLHLSRGGPVKLSLDPAYISNSTLLTSDSYKYFSNNALNPGNGLLNPEGTLSMDLRKKTKVSSNMNYAIVGMEMNLLYLKMLAEATILEKAYGVNLGIKIAF